MKTITKIRRGRPFKGSGNTKSIRLDMRIKITEKRAFCAAAELAGLDLSAWIRERLRLAARRELEQAGQQIPFVPSVDEFLEE